MWGGWKEVCGEVGKECGSVRRKWVRNVGKVGGECGGSGLGMWGSVKGSM